MIPKQWKERLLYAALPLTAVTIGCVAAQDSDPLAGVEVQNRSWASGRFIELQIETTQGRTILGQVGNDDVTGELLALIHELMEGDDRLDDLILPALDSEPIGVRLAVFDDGSVDACSIDVAEGSAFLGELDVQLQVTAESEFGGFSVLNRVEGEEACEGPGYFFEETESGEFGQISMCPSSCDVLRSAEEAGSSVMVDIVVDA